MITVDIDHYSDVLCVWAYISQVRMQQLRSDFPDVVDLTYHYFSVFGDIASKMDVQWAQRGGIAAYADHVHDVASGFEHLDIHTDVWRDNVPSSSMPAHLYLCAAAELEAEDQVHTGAQQRLDSIIRTAFFEYNLDVSDNDTRIQLVDQALLPVDMVIAKMKQGKAHARLHSCIQKASDAGVSTSPTLVFNEGRQMLAGNVGYKLIEANVRELLEPGADNQGWC